MKANDPIIGHWWNAKEGEAWKRVLSYVRQLENVQAPYFDKLVKLAAQYDVNARTNRYITAETMARRAGGPVKAKVTENLIASNVDTVAANVATADVRVRVQTDGADWSHQRRAKWMERYADGLGKLFNVGPKCRGGFKSGGAVKGTGINKVFVDRFEQIRLKPVPVDNIIVDEIEGIEPMQLHYRDFFDKEEMLAQYPKFTQKINNAQQRGSWTKWAGYRPIERGAIVVIESWRLPIGPEDHDEHVPGRHTICIDGCDLLDEPWEKPLFPFSVLRWNDPVWGWYGIGLAERILPHQNLLNIRNYQINASLNRKADPITWVKRADQDITTRSVAQIGGKERDLVASRHQAVGQETYANRREIKMDARDESGVSGDMAAGDVPAGVETGAAVREVRQTRTKRFTSQEKAFEQFWLDTVWLILDCCKDLGAKAPKILHVTDYGNTVIEWSKVDMGDVRIQLAAASTVSNSPAGRKQELTELAQVGVITIDEARDLMDHPDIERVISLYNAVRESVENAIERILEGEHLTPTPFMNLGMCVTIAQRMYLKLDVGDRDGGAPEEVLEALSDFISIAAAIQNPAPPPGMPGMPPQPGAPGAMMPSGGPQFPAGAASGPAQAAYAPGAFAPMTA